MGKDGKIGWEKILSKENMKEDILITIEWICVDLNILPLNAEVRWYFLNSFRKNVLKIKNKFPGKKTIFIL